MSHACVITKTFADGIGRCSCGQWWAAVPAQALIRSELRERLNRYKREVDHRRARDLRDAMRQAAARELELRDLRQWKAPWKWKERQSAKQEEWWRVIRHIIIVDPCAYCGAKATCVDHKMPRCRGGSNKRHNLVPACKSCNSAKCSRTPQEWRAARLARGQSWPPARSDRAADPAA